MAQEEAKSEDLRQFLAQWQADISQQHLKSRPDASTAAAPATASGSVSATLSDADTQALNLYIDAMESEGRGSLNEALVLYRRAFKLNRHVDRLYWQQMHHLEGQEPAVSHDFDIDAVANLGRHGHGYATHSIHDDDEDDVETPAADATERLTAQMQTMSLQVNGALIEREHSYKPAMHISVLPPEVILKIGMYMEHVVFPSVDMTSLEKMGQTCKSLYARARDPVLWRTACRTLWGQDCEPGLEYDMSWRRMFIERPRLRFDGVYVSKESYVRPGEKELNTYYAPCHVVEHYRYLRFFADGTLLSASTPVEPKVFIPQLRGVSHTDSAAAIWFGAYTLEGNNGVACRVVRHTHGPQSQGRRGKAHRDKAHARTQMDPYSQQLLNMHMDIRSVGGRLNNRLSWRRYTLAVNDEHGVIKTTDVDTRDVKPFHFVRVKNFS